MEINTIIIGGGISGLYLAYRLSQNKKKVMVFERNNYVGGRIYTYETNYKSSTEYLEGGAARFADIHKNVLSLINELGLNNNILEITNERIPIVRNLTYETKEDLDKIYQVDNDEQLDINYLLDKLLHESSKFSDFFLRNITFHNLAQHVLSAGASKFLLDAFGYTSQLLHLNAYDAVRMFRLDFNFQNQYYMLSCGLTKLCNILQDKIKKNGGIIHLNTEFKSYKEETNLFQVTVQHMSESVTYTCKNLILAIPKRFLLKLKNLHSIRNDLNAVIGHDLNKIYAIYPRNKIGLDKGKFWFHDLPKITTDNPLRYIIPYNKDIGLIIISYSDDRFARYWKQSSEKNTLEKDIHRYLQKIFPNKDIPKPIYLKGFFWKDGAHYYKIGQKSEQVYDKITKPFKSNIYIAGECYSLKQAWMEGALESANKVLTLINSTEN